MKEYFVKAVENEPDWSAVPALQVDVALWRPDPGIRMTGQFCYNANTLFVHLRCVETHIRAELNDPLAPVCDDSCMEFFFSPDPNSDRYFNIEINPNGCIYLGFRKDRYLASRLVPPQIQNLLHIQPRYTSDGWEVFYRIPLDFIQLFCPAFRLESGFAFRANCYKCGGKTLQPHYLVWNPIDLPTPEFHCPQYFGKFILE